MSDENGLANVCDRVQLDGRADIRSRVRAFADPDSFTEFGSRARHRHRARAALAEGGDRWPLVTRRRGERAWTEQHPGPASYGVEPDPPVLDGLPPEARFAAEAMLWNVERLYESGASGRRQAAGARTLTGVAASAGRDTGTRAPLRPEEGSMDPIATTGLYTAMLRARGSARPDRLFSDPSPKYWPGPQGNDVLALMEASS